MVRYLLQQLRINKPNSWQAGWSKNIQLVGGRALPLWKMSQLGWLFPIYGKIKNVPNHQPIFICWPLRVTFRYPWKIIQAEWLQTFSINGLMAIPKNVQFTTPKSSPWHICVYCLGTTPILGSPLGAAVEVTHGWFTVVLNLNKLGYQLYNYRYIYI